MSDKSIKIPLDIYEELVQEKDVTGINMNRLIRFAWELYKKSKEETEKCMK